MEAQRGVGVATSPPGPHEPQPDSGEAVEGGRGRTARPGDGHRSTVGSTASTQLNGLSTHASTMSALGDTDGPATASPTLPAPPAGVQHLSVLVEEFWGSEERYRALLAVLWDDHCHRAIACPSASESDRTTCGHVLELRGGHDCLWQSLSADFVRIDAEQEDGTVGDRDAAEMRAVAVAAALTTTASLLERAYVGYVGAYDRLQTLLVGRERKAAAALRQRGSYNASQSPSATTSPQTTGLESMQPRSSFGELTPATVRASPDPAAPPHGADVVDPSNSSQGQLHGRSRSASHRPMGSVDQSLCGLLIAPLQRMVQYRTLLQAILQKGLDPSPSPSPGADTGDAVPEAQGHPRAALQRALRTVSAVCKAMDATKDALHNAARLEEVAALLGAPCLAQRPGRRFLYDGAVMRVKGGDLRPCHLYLFSDALVLHKLDRKPFFGVAYKEIPLSSIVEVRHLQGGTSPSHGHCAAGASRVKVTLRTGETSPSPIPSHGGGGASSAAVEGGVLVLQHETARVVRDWANQLSIAVDQVTYHP